MAIYQQNGNWYIDYYYEGLRKRENVGPVSITTKQQAKQALAIRKAEIAQGKFHLKNVKSGMKLKEYIEKFWEWAQCNQRHPELWTGVYLKHFREYFGDSKRLLQITPKDIEDYKIERCKHIKPCTVNRELACLKRMYSLAVSWGLVDSNPVKKVKFFREESVKERILSSEEEEKLLSVCREPLKQIIIVALNTGMRLGEVINLKWTQVDLANGVIIVEHTKNGKIRKIPLNSTLRNLFEHDKMKSDKVFGEGNISHDAIGWHFKKAVKKAGIPHLRFHDLRHTFATRLVSNNIDLATVKELLGHSSITMTMRYAHPTPEHKIQAVESLVFPQKWTLYGHQGKPAPEKFDVTSDLSNHCPVV